MLITFFSVFKYVINPIPHGLFDIRYHMGGGHFSPLNFQALKRDLYLTLWPNFGFKWKFRSLAFHRHQKQPPKWYNFAATSHRITKVNEKKFSSQKNWNFIFWATETLYTSNESWESVELRFKKKKYDFLQKKFFFTIFTIFVSKSRPVSYIRGPVSLNFEI